nr:PEF-CTERM sorting domain-containing protein [Methanolobus chelungpuianus]
MKICLTAIQRKTPEFPTVALPVAAILGLAFLMQRRKEE